MAALQDVDPAEYPHLAATDYHSFPTREERAKAFAHRLETVIRGFEAIAKQRE